ncbi:MAG TPA: DUF5700 domain-containing putative Zn-dependent protease [Bacteroidia bacterium]|nr:DUF5700 domain-containing putative Zn-dependent protease [Bacteroidia bacterium]
MKYIKTVFAILCLASNAFSQKINVEAVSKFWTVVDYLKTDKPLTDSVWNSYYNLVGNKTYMENNRSQENVLDHRKYLELVFRPSLADSLKKTEKIKNKDQNEDIFQNLYFIKQYEVALRKYSKEIESPDYLVQSINLAKKFLPKNKYNPIPANLTIYIMAITYDAAVQDPNMYFGLACVYDLDKFQKGSIAAHELHHVLRKSRAWASNLSTTDSASFFIIDQINNEGCADLIDKQIFVDHAAQIVIGELVKSMLLGEAENTIRLLDSCFIVNAKSTTKFTTVANFKEITKYFSGHLPGFYMADIIKQNGYMQGLIENCDNPFNIFYLYNQAAKQDKRKPTMFSAEAIKYLKYLESK